MRGKREERLCDNLALRLTLSQRKWLEKFGNKRGVSICEGVRLLIDDAMNQGSDKNVNENNVQRCS